MRRSILVILACIVLSNTQAQKFQSESSTVTFYSHATIEDITAKNVKATSIFNSENGDIVFSIPIKEFQFAKSLMKEHFNEKYMETEKFPTATFQGKISGFDPKASGVQQATAKGKLTIHGITKEIEVPGTIEKKGQKMEVNAKFMAVLEDFKIARPHLLWQNIAEQVEVTIQFTYKPKKD